jgi:hypothetical protein
MVNFFKSKNNTSKSTIRIYKTIVLPTVCYECETWTMSERQRKYWLPSRGRFWDGFTAPQRMIRCGG